MYYKIMTRNIVVERLEDKLPSEKRVEIVERKGIGHPDSIADGIAESVSRALCKTYLSEFGRLMHHNTDQCEVIGGEVVVEWGGGEFLRPVSIILSGRAVGEVDGKEIPVHEIAIRAAVDYLKENIRHLDTENVVVESRIGRGSGDLINVFERGVLANDTSFGVGFAPYTLLEQLVLETEKFLNSKEVKRRFPFVGEDIKVMGLREGEDIKLTIAAAFVSRYFSSSKEYLDAKEELAHEVNDFVKSRADNVSVFINTADGDGENPSDFFLTISGTSAEQGDDGSVGRGNRVSGLITPGRPMSMEAAAGKNPYNHVGKIYNIFAFKVARRIYEELGSPVYVKILSQIGKPIDDPKIMWVQVKGKCDENRVKHIAEEELAAIHELTMEIINGKYAVF